MGTWNVRSMNQGKLDMVKQEMARVNIDVLGISELKWTRMSTKESEIQYLDAISKMTEWSLFASKANCSVSW